MSSPVAGIPNVKLPRTGRRPSPTPTVPRQPLHPAMSFIRPPAHLFNVTSRRSGLEHGPSPSVTEYEAEWVQTRKSPLPTLEVTAWRVMFSFWTSCRAGGGSPVIGSPSGAAEWWCSRAQPEVGIVTTSGKSLRSSESHLSRRRFLRSPFCPMRSRKPSSLFAGRGPARAPNPG